MGRGIGIVGLSLIAGLATVIVIELNGEGQPPVAGASPTEGVSSSLAITREDETRPPAVAPPPPEGPSAPAKVAAPPRPEGPPAPAEVTASRLDITFEDGRLSVRARNAPLGRLLEEISRRGKVAIIQVGGVAGRRVSVAFSDLPLDQGLRRILEQHDAFFYHRGGAALRVVWVYPKDEGRGLAPVPPEYWASTAELTQGLSDPDPDERARAIGAVVGRRGAKALDAVLKALDDEADQVRTEALYGASKAGVDLPAGLLSELARNDPSVDVRFLALEALADDPAVEMVALDALDDPSPHVRNQARQILGRLDAASRPPAPSRPAQGQQN